MNLLSKVIIPISALLALNACTVGDEEIDIPLTEVPANVINVVQDTLPGISLKEAEKEIRQDSSAVYELEGKLIDGKEYKIKISDNGTILKIELED